MGGQGPRRHVPRQVLPATWSQFPHLLIFTCLLAVASWTLRLHEASLLGRGPPVQSGQESFTWWCGLWYSKASGAAETAVAADIRQRRLALGLFRACFSNTASKY